jgi:hypothetical protein
MAAAAKSKLEDTHQIIVPASPGLLFSTHLHKKNIIKKVGFKAI